MPELWRKDKYIRLYLAGFSADKNITQYLFKYKPLYVLESIYYIRPNIIEYIKSPYCKSFMLDSGAFSF